MKITEVTYKCDICGKKFVNKRDVGCRISFDINFTDMDEMYGGNDVVYEDVCEECKVKVIGYIKEIKESKEIENNKEELDKVLSFN